MNIELHIEELVLRGVTSGKQHEIRTALEAKLAELLGGDGVARSLGREGGIGSLDAGSFEMKSSDDSQTIGARLAQSIFQGIVQ